MVRSGCRYEGGTEDKTLSSIPAALSSSSFEGPMTVSGSCIPALLSSVELSLAEPVGWSSSVRAVELFVAETIGNSAPAVNSSPAGVGAESVELSLAGTVGESITAAISSSLVGTVELLLAEAVAESRLVVGDPCPAGSVELLPYETVEELNRGVNSSPD